MNISARLEQQDSVTKQMTLVSPKAALCSTNRPLNCQELLGMLFETLFRLYYDTDSQRTIVSAKLITTRPMEMPRPL